MYKFNLEIEVIIDSPKDEKEYVIIGRAEFLNQPNRYMLQEISSYQKDGYRFDRGYWEYEHKLIEVK